MTLAVRAALGLLAPAHMARMTLALVHMMHLTEAPVRTARTTLAPAHVALRGANRRRLLRILVILIRF
jgi:hypothetical protein